MDFLVTRENEPWFLVQVKASGRRGVGPALKYFHEQLKTSNAFQVVYDLEDIEKDLFSYTEPVRVPAGTFLFQLI